MAAIRAASIPHPGGDLLLLRADSVNIDRGRLQLRMAHPFAKAGDGSAFQDGVDPVGMAQPFGALCGPSSMPAASMTSITFR